MPSITEESLDILRAKISQRIHRTVVICSMNQMTDYTLRFGLAGIDTPPMQFVGRLRELLCPDVRGPIESIGIICGQDDESGQDYLDINVRLHKPQL